MKAQHVSFTTVYEKAFKHSFLEFGWKLHSKLQFLVSNAPWSSYTFNLLQGKTYSMFVYTVARHHKHQQMGDSDPRSVLMGVGWIAGDLGGVEFRGGPPW